MPEALSGRRSYDINPNTSQAAADGNFTEFPSARARARARLPRRSRRSAKRLRASNWAALRAAAEPPDDRLVLSAYDLLHENDTELPPIIAAGPGFMLLVLHHSAKRKVSGYGAHPVIGWRLCHEGESPLPICFSIDVKYHMMCDCAVEAPTGKVTSFEGRSFSSAAAWLRNRRREMRRRS
jgi:hypothetical protein